MCSIKAHEKLLPMCDWSATSVGGRLIPNGSTIYVLLSLLHTLNFIDSWLQSFEKTMLGKQQFTEKNGLVVQKYYFNNCRTQYWLLQEEKQALLTYIGVNWCIIKLKTSSIKKY